MDAAACRARLQVSPVNNRDGVARLIENDLYNVILTSRRVLKSMV